MLTGPGVVSCRVLEGFGRLPFARFTSRYTFQRCERDPALTMLGASIDGRPIGLVVVDFTQVDETAVVESIFVEPSARRRGVARKLMDRLELISVESGMKTLSGSWYHDIPSASSVEGLFSSLGWGASQEQSTVHRGGRRLLEHGNRLVPKWRPHDGFEIEPWSSLSATDLARISALQDTDEIMTGLHPDGESMLSVSDQTSVVLRHRQEITGWMIHHVLGPEIVRYSSLWLRRDLIGRGLGIFLAIEAGRRHLAIVDRIPKMFFLVAKGNDGMSRFIARRLQPGLDRSSRVLMAKKKLAAP